MAGRVWWKVASPAFNLRRSFAFGDLSKGGAWSSVTTQSLFFKCMPSSGALSSKMLVASTRKEFDSIPEYVDINYPPGGGSLVRFPPYLAPLFNPLWVPDYSYNFGYYVEGQQFTGVYDGEYEPAQGSYPPGRNFPHDSFPLNQYPEAGFFMYREGPLGRPFAGTRGEYGWMFEWPQCLCRGWHDVTLDGFELFPLVPRDGGGMVTQTYSTENLSGCCSFALPGPRKTISSPNPPGYANDTFEFWYGLRSRVMTVGSGRHAFIARIVFNYYIANPYVYTWDEAGDIDNRQYFIESAHIVEDTFMLIHHQWKEIPVVSAFEGLSLTFIVIGETPAQWQARTGVTFT